MRRILFLLTVFLQASVALATPRQQHPEIPKLEISWHVYENHYLGKDQTLAGISILNQGQALPGTGWRIYFNFGKKMEALPPDINFNITHVNGGLYYLSPAKAFKGLGQNAKIEQRYVSNSWVINYTDAPNGFYLVWDDAPEKGFPLGEPRIVAPTDEQKMKRFAGDKERSAAQLFDLNNRGKDQKQSEQAKIFPNPLSYRETPGYFTINQSVKISADPAFSKEAQLLAEDLEVMLGKKPVITSANETLPIRLKNDNTVKKDSYTLSITSAGILISASAPREIHYGIQSLKTLLTPNAFAPMNKGKSIKVKCVEVMDQPLFGFRGVMVDVARNFQPKAEILKLLNLLSLYKLNTLHLHLNDDEGWRLQIKALPELTEVGSKRGHSMNEEERLMPSYGSGPTEGVTSGSGFYSREDFIDILKYAHDRHITVIPEIETPGHARAAIVSMQARYLKYQKLGDTLMAKRYLLRDVKDTSVYRSVQKWNDNVMDVSLPSVYNFLETVTDEVIEMYKIAGVPISTIHYGGDEVPAGVWTGSPSVNAFKTQHPEVKLPADLWNYFFGRIAAMLDKRGLYLSGWEETALHKPDLQATKKWQPNPVFIDRNFHVNV
ncbi:family 20 glycosylhydrolase, partial [Pedobacter sp.]|uniref:family 20 glycosylhydrolase n=1 Tax=Pedobacter sp. TaxID=1411316 RepID=UPI003D7F9657